MILYIILGWNYKTAKRLFMAGGVHRRLIRPQVLPNFVVDWRFGARSVVVVVEWVNAVLKGEKCITAAAKNSQLSHFSSLLFSFSQHFERSFLRKLESIHPYINICSFVKEEEVQHKENIIGFLDTLSIALYREINKYFLLIDTIFYFFFKHICKKRMHKIFGHRMKYNSSTTCSYRSALVNTKHEKRKRVLLSQPFL